MLEKRKVTLSQANRAERLMDGESLPHTYADYREACLAVISTRQPIEDCTMTGYQKVHLGTPSRLARWIKWTFLTNAVVPQFTKPKPRGRRTEKKTLISGRLSECYANTAPSRSNSHGKSPGKRSSPTKPKTPSPKRSRAEGAGTHYSPTVSAHNHSTKRCLIPPKTHQQSHLQRQRQLNQLHPLYPPPSLRPRRDQLNHVLPAPASLRPRRDRPRAIRPRREKVVRRSKPRERNACSVANRLNGLCSRTMMPSFHQQM